MKGKLMSNYPVNKSMEHYALAMAYVPWQHFNQIYDNLEIAYKEGTIFPELNKPFTGRRCIHGK